MYGFNTRLDTGFDTAFRRGEGGIAEGGECQRDGGRLHADFFRR